MRETFIRIENMKAELSWWFTIGLFILFNEDTSSASLGPIISTKAGSFQGLRVTPQGQNQAVHAFLGIPYAEPPTGALRFKMPKPITVIPGVFNATAKPPSCLQSESNIGFYWADQSSPMTEDCLYLNIWTPERHTEGELKPVMVYIHGGGFAIGSSAMDVYDGQVISTLGEVVVVTLNYRLTSLGFFSSLTDDAPGNVGLYDQLLALHWVNTNIEYFGGDQNRVTIFGESAGAMSVGFLALYPLSHGLFQRIIVQSASPYTPVRQNAYQAAEKGHKLALLTGCANATFNLSSHPKEVVECLQGLPASKLTKPYYQQQGCLLKEMNLWFQPIISEGVISSIFRSKDYDAYDVLIGVTKDEGVLMFSVVLREIFQQYMEGKLIMNKTFARNTLNDFFKQFDFVDPERVTDFYLKDVTEDQQSVVRAISECLGDFYIVCPTIIAAEQHADRGGRVQFYRFDHRPSTSPWPEWMGVTHFEEVQFVFGMPFRYPERYQDEEIKLSEYMIRTWTNFAKSENVTLKNGLQWPNFSRRSPKYATFDTEKQVIGTGERMDKCEFWRPYFDAS